MVDKGPNVEVTIENWSFGAMNDDGYTAPELWVMCLYGEVYGHPLRPDGTKVTTSRVVGITEDNLIKTLNRMYKLGEPKADYEAMYPNAKQRLIKQARKLEEE